jgi:hypothetical protein
VGVTTGNPSDQSFSRKNSNSSTGFFNFASENRIHMLDADRSGMDLFLVADPIQCK